MQLVPRVHLVGSGSGGFDLTDAFDCHVYLLDGGAEAALIDVGIGDGLDAILANVEAAGVAAERIRYVLLTHAHPDHAGGSAKLRERLPNAEVVASAPVAKWVRTGDEEAVSLELGKRAEFYPHDYRLIPAPVEREVAEGERIRVGELELAVVETPGHADGHLSYLVRVGERNVLFGGDLVFFGGLVSLEHTWDCRIREYGRSMAKLRDAAVDVLLPGHHGVSLDGGQRHVDAANRLFDHGFVPKSVV